MAGVHSSCAVLSNYAWQLRQGQRPALELEALDVSCRKRMSASGRPHCRQQRPMDCLEARSAGPDLPCQYVTCTRLTAALLTPIPTWRVCTISMFLQSVYSYSTRLSGTILSRNCSNLPCGVNNKRSSILVSSPTMVDDDSFQWSRGPTKGAHPI